MELPLQAECSLHPGEELVLQCKDCSGNIQVCRLCITELHAGHRFDQIPKGAQKKPTSATKGKHKKSAKTSKKTNKTMVSNLKETLDNTSVQNQKDTHENTSVQNLKETLEKSSVQNLRDTHENMSVQNSKETAETTTQNFTETPESEASISKKTPESIVPILKDTFESEVLISKDTHKKTVQTFSETSEKEEPISKHTNENTFQAAEQTLKNTVPVFSKTVESTLPSSKETQKSNDGISASQTKCDKSNLRQRSLDVCLSIVQTLRDTAEKCENQMLTVRNQADEIKHLLKLVIAKHIRNIESNLELNQESFKDCESKFLRLKRVPSLNYSDESLQYKFSSGSGDPQPDKTGASTICLPDREIAIRRYIPCSNPRAYIEQAFESDDPAPFIDLAFGHIEETTMPLSQYLRRDSIRSHIQNSRSLVQSIASSPFESSLNLLSTHPAHKTNSTLRFYSGPNNPDGTHEGQILKTLKLNVQVWKICLHPITDDLFCCSKEDNSIRQINKENGNTIVLFHTKSEPWSIGCTNDHMIVGLEKKVLMYTYAGITVKTFPLDHIPLNISVCKESGRIALTCNNGAVVLLNKDFEFAGRYVAENEQLAPHVL